MARVIRSTWTPLPLGAAHIALSVWFALCGCETTAKIMDAKPAPDAGFVEEPERMAPDKKRYPLDRVWFDSKFDWKNFDSIVVAPIDTTHLLKMNLWDEANMRGGRIEKDAAEVAVKIREIFQKAFREDPKKRYKVVDKPGKSTVVLELALVEVIPDKAWLGALNLGSWVAPLPVGVAVGAAASMLEGGAIAMEGRVRDGGTHAVMGIFADREVPRTRIVDFQALTWYYYAYQIAEDWAGEFVEIVNTPEDHQVKHAPWFTLKPW